MKIRYDWKTNLCRAPYKSGTPNQGTQAIWAPSSSAEPLPRHPNLSSSPPPRSSRSDTSRSFYTHLPRDRVHVRVRVRVRHQLWRPHSFVCRPAWGATGAVLSDDTGRPRSSSAPSRGPSPSRRAVAGKLTSFWRGGLRLAFRWVGGGGGGIWWRVALIGGGVWRGVVPSSCMAWEACVWVRGGREISYWRCKSWVVCVCVCVCYELMCINKGR